MILRKTTIATIFGNQQKEPTHIGTEEVTMVKERAGHQLERNGRVEKIWRNALT